MLGAHLILPTLQLCEVNFPFFPPVPHYYGCLSYWNDDILKQYECSLSYQHMCLSLSVAELLRWNAIGQL
jgi:hypothetical protein